MRISTLSAIEKARPRSMRKAGIGRKKTARIAMMPTAKPISRVLLRSAFTGPAATAPAIAIAAPSSSAGAKMPFQPCAGMMRSGVAGNLPRLISIDDERSRSR